MTGSIRVGFADPPYPGQAEKHYSDDPRCAEVDHVQLVRKLNAEFPDGWALSTGARQRLYVELAILEAEGIEVPRPLPREWDAWVALEPKGYRMGVWAKPLVFFKPGVNPAYSWEPVFWKGGRKRSRKQATTYDYVIANATFGKGVHGTKPAGFWTWLFDTLNLQPGDEFEDLFPGSGGGAAAWSAWRRTTQATLGNVVS